MADADYEYRGLMARTWDILRGETLRWEDREYYEGLIERIGQPVLDVGCGTGRLLLDYLQQGIDIDGVDVSPEMLDICREKARALGLAPNLYVQSMERMELPRKYRMIFVPSSSFQLVLDPSEAEETMRRFHAHLLPGGMLVMPFFRVWKEGDTLDTGWTVAAAVTDEREGTLVKRWSRSRFEPERRLEHTEDRYEISRGEVTLHSEHHRRSPATRWYAQEESIGLFADAGFEGVEIRQGFPDRAVTATDALWTVWGRKGE